MPTAISNRQPEVFVEYNSLHGRVVKHFTNAYTARSFYVKQDRLGNNPSIKRSTDMPTFQSPTTTKKATTKKRTSSKKRATTKAKKAPAKKTTKKATASKNGVDKAAQQLRRQAKAVDITSVQYKVLQAINKHGGSVKGDGLTYRGIEKHTGYYSILTAVMRDGYEDSLCSKGLTREKILDVDGRDTLHFTLTANGKKTLDKAAKVS